MTYVLIKSGGHASVRVARVKREREEVRPLGRKCVVRVCCFANDQEKCFAESRPFDV
jgi:hypothetical protein